MPEFHSLSDWIRQQQVYGLMLPARLCFEVGGDGGMRPRVETMKGDPENLQQKLDRLKTEIESGPLKAKIMAEINKGELSKETHEIVRVMLLDFVSKNPPRNEAEREDFVYTFFGDKGYLERINADGVKVEPQVLAEIAGYAAKKWGKTGITAERLTGKSWGALQAELPGFELEMKAAHDQLQVAERQATVEIAQNIEHLTDDQKTQIHLRILSELQDPALRADMPLADLMKQTKNVLTLGILQAAQKKNLTLEAITGVTVTELQAQADSSRRVALAAQANVGSPTDGGAEGQGILDQAKGMAGGALDKAGELLGKAGEKLSELFEEHPVLATMMFIAGAAGAYQLASYGLNRVANMDIEHGDSFTEHWGGKLLRGALGIFIAGRVLQLDVAKKGFKTAIQKINQMTGFQINENVDDNMLTGFMVRASNGDFRGAMSEILPGAVVGAMTTGELQEMSTNFEGLLFDEGGIPDIIFGKAFEKGERTTLRRLQVMIPPRVKPSKKLEELSQSEKLLVMRETLRNPGGVPEVPRQGKEYKDLTEEEKKKLEVVDTVFEQYDVMEAQVDKADSKSLLEQLGDMTGLGDFSSVLGQLDESAQIAMAHQLRGGIKAYWGMYRNLKDDWMYWKEGKNERDKKLSPEKALQFLELQEIFRAYTDGVSNLTKEEALSKLWRIPTTLFGAGIAAGGGFMAVGHIIEGGAATVALVGTAALIGGKAVLGAIGAAAGAVGWTVAAPLLLTVGAGTIAYIKSSNERQRKLNLSSSEWKAVAREMAPGKDYVHFLYDMVYRENPEDEWNFSSSVKEFFSFEASGLWAAQQTQIRQRILESAVTAELESVPIPDDPGYKRDFHRIERTAKQFIEREYRVQKYRPGSAAEASRWVEQAIRAGQLELEGKSVVQARDAAFTGQKTVGEAQHGASLDAGLEGSNNPLDKTYLLLKKYSPEAQLALAADLRLASKIGENQLLREMFSKEYFEDNDAQGRYSKDAEYLASQVPQMTASYGALNGRWEEMKKSSDDVFTEMKGDDENEVNVSVEGGREWKSWTDNLWTGFHNAEANRLAVFLLLYEKFEGPEDRAILAMASCLSQKLRNIRDLSESTDGDENHLYRRVNFVLWQSMPDIVNKLRSVSSPQERLAKASLFFEYASVHLSRAIGVSSPEELTKILDRILSQPETLPLAPSFETLQDGSVRDRFAGIASQLLDINLLDKHNGSRDLKIDLQGKQLLVSSFGMTQRLEYMPALNAFRLGKINFELTPNGILHACMISSALNATIDTCKSRTDFSYAKKGDYFYTGGNWFHDSLLGYTQTINIHDSGIDASTPIYRNDYWAMGLSDSDMVDVLNNQLRKARPQDADPDRKTAG